MKRKKVYLTFSRRPHPSIADEWIYHIDAHLQEDDYIPVERDWEKNISKESWKNIIDQINEAFKTHDINLLKDVGEVLEGTLLNDEVIGIINQTSDHLFISSNDYFIPWHIIRLPNSKKENDFLGILHPFSFVPKTRCEEPKVVEKKETRAIIISNPRKDIDLKYINDEANEIADIFKKCGIHVEIVPNDEYPRITQYVFRQILRSGNYDIIHFAGHGQYQHGRVWLNLYGDSTFRPADLESIRGLPSNPILFFNACFTGTAGDYYFGDTTNGVNQFGVAAYANRARIFIGTLAGVYDLFAKEFAIEFYKNLLIEGKSLGNSILTARISAYKRYQDISWANYICYGDPTTTFYTLREEEKMPKNYLYNSDASLLSISGDIVNKGISWLMKNQNIWVGDVHVSAEVLNVIHSINSNIIEEELHKRHKHWFRMRLQEAFDIWLNNSLAADKDIGICSRCKVGISCNFFLGSYVDGIFSKEFDKRMLHHLLEAANNYGWYFANRNGYKKISPGGSALVINWLIKHKKLFEESTNLNFEEYIGKYIELLIHMQSDNGGWETVSVPSILGKDKTWSDDLIIETGEGMVGTLVNAKRVLPHKTEIINRSLAEIKRFFLSEKNMVGDVCWWDCKSHGEDREISEKSDVRATSYAIKSLLLCGEKTNSNVILGGIHWLIQQYDAVLGWPLDTRYAPDKSSIASTLHAISSLFLWIKTLIR